MAASSSTSGRSGLSSSPWPSGSLPAAVAAAAPPQLKPTVRSMIPVLATSIEKFLDEGGRTCEVAAEIEVMLRGLPHAPLEVLRGATEVLRRSPMSDDQTVFFFGALFNVVPRYARAECAGAQVSFMLNRAREAVTTDRRYQLLEDAVARLRTWESQRHGRHTVARHVLVGVQGALALDMAILRRSADRHRQGAAQPPPAKRVAVRALRAFPWPADEGAGARPRQLERAEDVTDLDNEDGGGGDSDHDDGARGGSGGGGDESDGDGGNDGGGVPHRAFRHVQKPLGAAVSDRVTDDMVQEAQFLLTEAVRESGDAPELVTYCELLVDLAERFPESAGVPGILESLVVLQKQMPYHPSAVALPLRLVSTGSVARPQPAVHLAQLHRLLGADPCSELGLASLSDVWRDVPRAAPGRQSDAEAGDAGAPVRCAELAARSAMRALDVIPGCARAWAILGEALGSLPDEAVRKLAADAEVASRCSWWVASPAHWLGRAVPGLPQRPLCPGPGSEQADWDEATLAAIELSAALLLGGETRPDGGDDPKAEQVVEPRSREAPSDPSVSAADARGAANEQVSQVEKFSQLFEHQRQEEPGEAEQQREQDSLWRRSCKREREQ